MDPIEMEKFQAMKRYKRCSFLYRVVQYTLTILSICLFLSSPLWIPKIISSIKFFLFVFLPGLRAVVMGPKCLFVLCNIIVVVLIGESRRSGSMSSPDIYEEYVEQRKMLRKVPTDDGVHQCKGREVGNEKDMEVVLLPVVEGRIEKEEVVEKREEELEEEEEGVGGGEVQEEEEEEEEGGGEEEEEEEEDDDEESGLPADELNKRVEDFIAKMTEQRRLEMLFCS